MSRDDVRQIKVGKHTLGIIGLTHVIEEVAKDFAERDDSEIQIEFLSRLSISNYIPDSMQDIYARAFLREFKKYIGEPYDEEVSEGLEIKVLGPGCPKCKQTEEVIMKEYKIITQQCCALNTNIMILACSGCANVGQLSNQAAVELTREGFGKMSCLAGIGGRLSGFIQSAKDTPEMVVIGAGLL